MVGFLASGGEKLVVSKVQALRDRASCPRRTALESHPPTEPLPTAPPLTLARLHH